ncbi:MAG: hypothetical protein IT462_15640 [Planctomycetes bacterium]|nr:hypothetical protein [Planctomycetota bacterium]
MNPTKLLATLAVFLAVLGASLRPAAGQEAPKPAAETEKPSAEFTLAKERVGKLTSRERAIYTLLLRLIRPRFGNDTAVGDSTALRPLEDAIGGPLSNLELLRLWAVLETGISARRELDGQLRRLIDSPMPSAEPSLARCGAEVLAIRAALRTGTGHKLALEDRVKALVGAVDKSVQVTTLQSAFASNTLLKPQWFANHMWRALVVRAAADMKLVEKSKQWERDLDLLLRAFAPISGFTALREQARDNSNDLHCNLFAWAALQLSQEAPEKLLGKATITEAARKIKSSGEVLARLGNTYDLDTFAMGQLSIAMLIGRTMAPTGTEPAKWRERLLADCEREAVEPPPVPAAFVLPFDLGFDDIRYLTSPMEAVEAADQALYLIGICGGLWSNEARPLAGKELPEVGMLLHCIHTVESTEQKIRVALHGNDERLNAAVSDAIERGCRYIANQQVEGGSFEGDNGKAVGRHALCVLTLLHSGYERSNPTVKRGMNYMTRHGTALGSYSYEAGIILMMFQKYYEPEAVKAGMFTARTARDYARAREAMSKSLPADHREIIQSLVHMLNSARHPRSGWGYNVGNGDAGWRDNSNSQYAMLGYKAASLLGAEVRDDIFTEEAKRLIADFSPSNYEAQPRAVRAEELARAQNAPEPAPAKETDATAKPKTPATSAGSDVAPGGWSYNCNREGFTLQMTAAGVSSLMVCLDELKMRAVLEADLERRIRDHIERGLALTGLLGFGDKAPFYGEFKRVAPEGQQVRVNLYNMYSVERACVMTGALLLCAKYDWYRTMAWQLVDTQRRGGSWYDRVTDTCWAVLCLRCAGLPVISEPRTPITPDVRKPGDKMPEKPAEPKKPVITEGPKGGAPKDPNAK